MVDLAQVIIRARDESGGAFSSLKSNTRSAEDAINRLRSAFGALGIGLGAGYFLHAIKGAIDAQDEISKLSQKINVSVESITGWRHAADLAGVSNEALTKGIKSMASQMFDAASGLAESQRYFAALGIEIHKTGGTLKDTDQLMLEVADDFAAMKDGTEKTALAVKLFGKAGLDMIPMLNQGSAAIATMIAEGRALNPVTEESARQSELFNDSMTRLGKSFSATGTRILNDLLPMVSELAKMFADDAVAGAMEKASRNASDLDSEFKPLTETIRTLTILGGNFSFTFTQMGIILASYAANVSALAHGGISAFLEMNRTTDKILADERAKFDAWERRVLTLGKLSASGGVNNPWDAESDSLNVMPARSFGKLGADAADAADSAYRGLLKTLKEKLLVDKQLTEVNKLQLALDAMSDKNRATITPAREKELKALAVQVDLNNQLKKQREADVAASQDEEDMRKGIAEAMGEATAARGENLIAAYKNVEQMEFENRLITATNTERETAIALRQLETSNIDRQSESYAKLRERLKAAIADKNVIEEAQRQQVSLWQSIESTAHDTFVSIFDSGKSAFDRLRDTLKNGLYDLLYQMTLKKWVINIAGSVGGAGLAQSAFGSTGGSSLLSGGASLLQMLGGGIGGSFGNGLAYAGSSGVGILGGLSEAFTGGGSLGWSLGTAMPAIGLGLGALSLLGAFGGSGGGPASFTGIDVNANLGQGGAGLNLFGTSQNSDTSFKWPTFIPGNLQDTANAAVAEAFKQFSALAKGAGYDTSGLAGVSANVSFHSASHDAAVITQDLINNLGTLTDQMAQAVIPNIKNFQQANETLTQTFVRIATQQHELDIQLLEAQGNTAAALAARRNDELSAMDESLRATQLAIYAAQDAAKAQQDLANAQSQAASASGSLQSAVSGLPGQLGITALQQFSDSLKVSDSLAPLERLNNAKSLLSDTYNRAIGGDLSAVNAFPNMAQQLLGVGRDVYASGPQFQQLFVEVNRELQDVLGRQRDVQSDLLRSVDVSIIQASQDSVATLRKGFSDMVAKLNELQDEVRRLREAA